MCSSLPASESADRFPWNFWRIPSHPKLRLRHIRSKSLPSKTLNQPDGKMCVVQSSTPKMSIVVVVVYLLKHITPISIKHSPSWGTDSQSAGQETRRLFWNPDVHYCVHKSPPLIPILIQVNSVHTYNISLRYIRILLSSHLCLCLPSALPFRFSYQNFVRISQRATCPFHLITSDLITLTIIGEACKLCCSSLCNLLQLPAIFSLLAKDNSCRNSKLVE
jgi:hypothetical protein